jgi:hypothetical protein
MDNNKGTLFFEILCAFAIIAMCCATLYIVFDSERVYKDRTNTITLANCPYLTSEEIYVPVNKVHCVYGKIYYDPSKVTLDDVKTANAFIQCNVRDLFHCNGKSDIITPEYIKNMEDTINSLLLKVYRSNGKPMEWKCYNFVVMDKNIYETIKSLDLPLHNNDVYKQLNTK